MNSKLPVINQNDKLKSFVRKKIMTSFIGALDDFEKSFGYLWEEDDDLFELWSDVRQSIMDRGHRQINHVDKEIDKLNITNKIHHYDFEIKRHPYYS